MASDGGVDNTNKFSSPMPTIGVYIAIASGACLVFIVVDIISGFRHKKRWIPCKLFSLNSLTLTLIAIATKLSSDLTTPMLYLKEQESKLTGIVFMSTCMNMFLPSLGSNTPSQNLSNMISLTILVITVVVNVSIQHFTGAMTFFIEQESKRGAIDIDFYAGPFFLLFFLFLLLSSLVGLWVSASEINTEINIISEPNKENLRNGSGSMICRLRCCYVRSYITNPQLLLSMNHHGFFLGLFSLLILMCSLFFLHGGLETCDGCEENTSDYKWSIALVSTTQQITILVSSIVTLFRCFMFRGQIGLHTSVNFLLSTVESLQVMQMINHKTAYQHLLCAATRVLVAILSIRLKATLLVLRVRAALTKYLCIGSWRGSVPDSVDGQQENVKKWIQKKGEQEVDKIIDLYRKDSPSHLIQLLSETLPSDEHQLHDYHPSCLSAVLLLRMASDTFSCHPLTRRVSLIHAFDEVFPIILFIDKNTSVTSFENIKKQNFAEKMWKLWDFKSPLKISDIGKVTNYIHSTTGLRTTQRESYFSFIQKEISFIENTIDVLSNNDNPYVGLQQVLADMLHKFLAKFPIAVFKYVTEASVDESEDRIKLAINFLCRLESLEDKIQWEFPSETNITSLITPPPSP